ncbi:MAG: tyrosine recombinase [Planctomycetota bacterium]
MILPARAEPCHDRDAVPSPPPAAGFVQQIDAFLTYLQVERGSAANTREAYSRDMLKFAHYLQSVGLADFSPVTPAHIEAFLTLLRGGVLPVGASTTPAVEMPRPAPVGASSAARNLATLKSFFRFLAVEENLKNNPARVVPMPRRRKALPKALAKSEVLTLLHTAAEPTLAPPASGLPRSAAPSVTSLGDDVAGSGPRGAADPAAPWRASLFLRDLAVLECLYATGMRVSELCGLRLSDVDFAAGAARVTGKGGRQRLCALNETAGQVLQLYIEKGRPLVHPDPREQAVFLSRRGRPVERTAVFRLVKQVARTADLQTGRPSAAGFEVRVSPHVFRHSFGTHLVEGGANLRVVQELLGHANIATTEIYTRVDPTRLIELHARFHPRARSDPRPSTAP